MWLIIANVCLIFLNVNSQTSVQHSAIVTCVLGSGVLKYMMRGTTIRILQQADMNHHSTHIVNLHKQTRPSCTRRMEMLPQSH